MFDQFVDSVFQRARLKLTLKRNGNQDHLVIMAWFIFGHCSLHPLPHYFPTFSSVLNGLHYRRGGWWTLRNIIVRNFANFALRISRRKPRPAHSLSGAAVIIWLLRNANIQSISILGSFTICFYQCIKMILEK